jgi:hypothetical protein
MIDIKAIRAATSGMYPNGIGTTNATVLALCDEIERLRADAARYQWLRNKGDGWYVGTEYATYNDVVVDGECANYSGLQTRLDAAIDAAMEAKT